VLRVAQHSFAAGSQVPPVGHWQVLPAGHAGTSGLVGSQGRTAACPVVEPIIFWICGLSTQSKMSDLTRPQLATSHSQPHMLSSSPSMQLGASQSCLPISKSADSTSPRPPTSSSGSSGLGGARSKVSWPSQSSSLPKRIFTSTVSSGRSPREEWKLT
jgi:hypothetical protein